MPKTESPGLDTQTETPLTQAQKLEIEAQEREQFSITLLTLSNLLLKIGAKCHQLTSLAQLILQKLSPIISFQL